MTSQQQQNQPALIVIGTGVAVEGVQGPDGRPVPCLIVGNDLVRAQVILTDPDHVTAVIDALTTARRSMTGLVVAGLDELPGRANGHH